MIHHFKRLSKQTIIYGLGDIIIKAIAFVLIPLHTRRLDLDEYGEYALLAAIETVLPIILSFGFNAAILKVFYDYDNEPEKKEVISTALIFIVLSGIPTILLLIFNAEILARWIGFREVSVYTPLLQLTFGSAFFGLFRLVTLSVLRAYERSVTFSVVNILNFSCLILFNIFLVGIKNLKVTGIVLSSFFTQIIIAIMVMITIFRHLKFAFSGLKLKKLFKFGLPLMPGGIAAWLLTLADRYLLNKLLGPESVGLYEIGHKFGMIVNMLLVHPFRTAWLPFIFSIQKDKDAPQIYIKTLTYYMLLGITLCLGLAVCAREMVLISSTTKFLAAYPAIPLIALAYLFYGIYLTVDVGVLVKEKTGMYTLISWIGALLDIGLAFLLIPYFGMLGAGEAKLIAFILLALLMYFFSQRFFPLRYELGRIGQLFLLAGVLYAVSWFIPLQPLWFTIGLKLLLITLFPILLVLFGFFTAREKEIVLNFIKKKFKLGQ